METIWHWGLALIVAVQHLRTPLFDSMMRAVTFLGDEEFYLLLLPLLWWSVDVRLIMLLAAIFLLSVVLNGVLKDLLMQPRPCDFDPMVAIIIEKGYGLPSGHAQSAAVVWGSVAGWTRRRWVKTVAIALVVLIGLSRV